MKLVFSFNPQMKEEMHFDEEASDRRIFFIRKTFILVQIKHYNFDCRHMMVIKIIPFTLIKIQNRIYH